MPEPGVLRLHASDGQVLVTCGRSLLYRYDAGDTGMRNLAIVALTDAGRRVDEVAAVFGLTATYVSILRGRARSDGSAGLVRRRGRPPKLSERQVTQARTWAGAGLDPAGDRRAARGGPVGDQRAARPARPPAGAASAARARRPEPEPTEPDTEPSRQPSRPPPSRPAPSRPEPPSRSSRRRSRWPAVHRARPGSPPGTYRCRYAGAMLLHAYLHRVGAEAIFATLTGGPARRYDDLAVLTTATLGFALGIDTVEGTKHLRRGRGRRRARAGHHPASWRRCGPGWARWPTAADPLALQRAFAAGMLAADPAADPVYFVDDHFVPYAGARPVGQGLEHQTPPRPARPRRHPAGRRPRPRRRVRLRRADRAVHDPARGAGPATSR